jgi:hypothetical protein
MLAGRMRSTKCLFKTPVVELEKERHKQVEDKPGDLNERNGAMVHW